MTPTKCQYAQIEKECLGLVYGVEQFHICVWVTDICGKDRAQTINSYHQKEPESDAYKNSAFDDAIAEVWHESTLKESTLFWLMLCPEMQYWVKNILKTPCKLKQIVVQTEKDSCLQQVITHLNDGWSRGECAQYYNIRAELSVVKELLLRLNRIIIPQSLHREMLKRLHKGYLGEEKYKRSARTVIY